MPTLCPLLRHAQADEGAHPETAQRIAAI